MFKCILGYLFCAFLLCFGNTTKAQDTPPQIQDLEIQQESADGESQSLPTSIQPNTTEDDAVLDNSNVTSSSNPRKLDIITDMDQKIAIREPRVIPENLVSLFYTGSEYALIREAIIGLKAGPQQGLDFEALADPNASEEEFKPPMGPRELVLAGIVYVSGDDWTVWFNNQRLTPTAILPEMLDLKVYKEYIEVKWFDAYTNQIFPVRLRPHQRFNIDSRIFLPGSDAL